MTQSDGKQIKEYLAQFSGESPDENSDTSTFTIQTDEDMQRFEAMVNRRWHEDHDPYLLEKTADD